MIFNLKFAQQFRAAVAERLGLGSTASNGQIFAELDHKRAAKAAADELYKRAWGTTGASHLSPADDVLYRRAWGSSTEGGGR